MKPYNNKYIKYVLVCVGDSLTDDLWLTHLRDNKYADYFYEDLNISPCPPSAHWSNLIRVQTGMTVINRGICGTTSGTILSKFQVDVLDNKPNFCIIWAGANDVAQDVVPLQETFLNNIDTMVKLCTTNNIVPILVTYPHRWIDPYQSAYETINIANVHVWLSTYAENNDVILFDLYSIDLFVDGVQDTTCYTDKVHESAKGCMKIAQYMLDRFDEIITDPLTYRYTKTYNSSLTWKGTAPEDDYILASNPIYSNTRVRNGVLELIPPIALNTYTSTSSTWQGTVNQVASTINASNIEGNGVKITDSTVSLVNIWSLANTFMPIKIK